MLCKRKRVRIVEAEMCPDHVHMFIKFCRVFKGEEYVNNLRKTCKFEI